MIPTSPPHTRGHRTAFVLLALITALAGLVVISRVGGSGGKARAIAEARVPAGRFLDLLVAHRFQAVHTFFGLPRRLPGLPPDVPEMQMMIEKQWGSAVGHSDPVSASVRIEGGVTYVSLRYNQIFRHGSVPILVILVRHTDGWQVVNCHYLY